MPRWLRTLRLPVTVIRPLAVLLPLVLVGCASAPRITRPEEFGPSTLRVHPTFTQVKDWTGDKKPDGVEVVVELLDSFGEPTRGNGSLLFELWSFRKYDPDPLGTRVAGPWRGGLLTNEDQAGHWSPALRAYTFQLAWERINDTKEYVLTGTFETAGGADRPGGGRLFDRLILEPTPGKKLEDRGVGRARGQRS
jgi:hypothetical protein